MGIEYWFMPRAYLAGELSELEQRMKSFTRIRSTRTSLLARVVELEGDLARVALLARALADLCIAKGVLTKDELMRQVLDTDFADGARDQGLDPRVVMPGESKLADLEPIEKPKPRRRR